MATDPVLQKFCQNLGADLMTAVIIWMNEQEKGLWAVSDTKVSSTDGLGKLIGNASKILPLPIVMHLPHTFENGIQWSNVYSGPELGLCFAGSTIVAQNTYLALAQLLGNLQIKDKEYIPSFSSIAEYIFKYVEASWNETKYTMQEKGVFEIAVFGYCLVDQEFSIYRYYVDPMTKNILVQHKKKPKDLEFIVLGDKRTEIEERISQEILASGAPGRPAGRAPRRILEGLLEDTSFPTIGSGIQLAISTSLGFRIIPTINGKTGECKFLGLDITDFFELDKSIAFGTFMY